MQKEGQPFQYMVLEQLDIYKQKKKKNEFQLYAKIKNRSWT